MNQPRSKQQQPLPAKPSKPTYERLLALSQEMDDVDIAKLFGVKPRSVGRWRQAYHIPSRSPSDANRLAWRKGKFANRRNGMARPEVAEKLRQTKLRQFRENPELGRQHAERLRKSERAKAAARAHGERLRQHYTAHPELRKEIGRKAREYYEKNPQAKDRMREIKRRQAADPRYRKKISLAKQGITEEAWAGFWEPINVRIRKSALVKEAGAKALHRDNYKCKMLLADGTRCGSSRKVEANHIIPFREIVTEELRARTRRDDFSWVSETILVDPNNQITLCRVHHQPTIWREHEYEGQFMDYVRSVADVPLLLPQRSVDRPHGYKLKISRAEICARRQQGETLDQIALAAGVRKQRVWQILNAKNVRR